MTQFYDWEKTLSYDADITIVIGSRGIGKTFGIRKQSVKDFLRDGSRFVECVRFKNSLSGISRGYFNRIGRLSDFKGYVFMTDSAYMYIAEDPGDGKRPKWELLGYFVALSDYQMMKTHTFDKVRRIIFDEFTLDRFDRFHRYLQNEYGILANMVDTLSRELPDGTTTKPRVYLLGNACDIANPYFAAYNIGTDITYGYRWYNNKTVLLHYVDPGKYAADKSKNTVAGRMFVNSSAGDVAVSNEFQHMNSEFVMRKTKNAKFSFGIKLNGYIYGIWVDISEGYYFVTSKVPNNTGRPIYYLSRNDASVNYIAAKSAGDLMKYVGEVYYLGLLRYESEEVQMRFEEVLQMFGIR